MQRLAIAVVLSLSVLACQPGGPPTQPTPDFDPAREHHPHHRLGG